MGTHRVKLDERIPGSHNFLWKEILYCPQWGVHVFPSALQYGNLVDVIQKLEAIRKIFDSPIKVTSGLRPPIYNGLIGGALGSAHQEGLAMDFIVQGRECDFVREKLQYVLTDLKIRMEDLPGSNWVHIDIREPNSGQRFFQP